MQDGLILNIGSIAGLEPMKSTPVYAASKWGLRGWSLSNYEVHILRPLPTSSCLHSLTCSTMSATFGIAMLLLTAQKLYDIQIGVTDFKV